VIISGTNNSGLAGSYYVLAATNTALPLSTWTRIATNAFVGGNFSFTNDVNLPQRYYLLQLP
jgi:hypothetical protein